LDIVYVAWLRYHRRAELLAHHLGGETCYVVAGRPGKIYQAPVRYLVQTWQTWQQLRRRRPRVVLVQNPPIFAVVAVALYARTHRAGYAIDSHTGAFVSPGWRHTLWLHRLLSRRALVTIVHNRDQEEIVRKWGCRYCRLGFTPGVYPQGRRPVGLAGGPAVAVIASYAQDEPLEEVLRAAVELSHISFYFTGDDSRLSASLRDASPPNCYFTGYLPYEEYIGLLRAADAVMVLTKRDHSLLMGGFEAASLAKPLITSDWPVLRDFFCLGTVHVPNTVDGICSGVRRAVEEREVLQAEMAVLRDRLGKRWEEELAALTAALLEGEPARQTALGAEAGDDRQHPGG